MKRKTTHVVPRAKGWAVKLGGSRRAALTTKTKSDAIKKARAISRRRGSELLIHNRNGKIGKADSHGGDPHPPPG